MDKNNYIIDTNILIAANGNARHLKLSDTIKCQKFTASLFVDAVISIDDKQEIFTEYFRYANRSGQPGIGDAFAKYLWDHQFDNSKCEIVKIEFHERCVYSVLADKESLLSFDRNDLKFIAVYFGSRNNPVICNACDSDWKEKKALLDEYSVKILEILDN
jgi:hypothetical protein